MLTLTFSNKYIQEGYFREPVNNKAYLCLVQTFCLNSISGYEFFLNILSKLKIICRGLMGC